MHMPRTKLEKVAAVALACIILGAGAVVAGKHRHNVYIAGQLAWERLSDLTPHCPIDREGLRKYSKSQRPRLTGDELTKYSARYEGRVVADMADNWGDLVQTDERAGTTWSGNVCVRNLDDWLGLFDTQASCGISTVGCAASITYQTYDDRNYPEGSPPAAWDEEQQQAWLDWYALIDDENGVFWTLAYLYKAEVTAGSDTDYVYKVVGSYRSGGVGYYPKGDNEWVGDSEWVLPFTFGVTNVGLYDETGTVNVTNKTTPRDWVHRDLRHTLRATDATGVTATLGDLSVADTYDLTDGAGTGEPVSTAIAECVRVISYGTAPAEDTTYASIEGLDIGGGAGTLTLNANFWSDETSAPQTWTAAAEDPGGSIWRCFDSGGVFTIHRIGTSTGDAACSVSSGVGGPVRFNVMAGRFAVNSGFDVPNEGDFRITTGLTYWETEEDTVNVEFPVGLSAYYCDSLTWLTGNVNNRLSAGCYQFDQPCYALVKQAWLDDNGEDLESGACNNHYASILVHSIRGDHSSAEPWWGPLLTLTHTDISADIPPGQIARPSSWVAGTGATIDPGDNTSWVASVAGATVTRTLVSRYPLRMDYIDAGIEEDGNYDPDWPIQNTANENQTNDIAAWATAVPVEDVTCYDNSRLLQVTFDSVPAEIDWSTARLTLAYSHYNISDPCYTCFEHRVGAEHEWTYTREDHSTTFLPDMDISSGTDLYFDLGQLVRTNEVHLQHVRTVTLTLPEAGSYELSDVKLVQDTTREDELPEYQNQQAQAPWNWLNCKAGMGFRWEGMNTLNIANGTEGVFSGDAQRGIWQTQYRQHCPESEAEGDLTYVVPLSRIADVINWQEQRTATYDTDAREAAMVDDDDNDLGAVYPWDLRRNTGDDSDGTAALRVKRVYGLGGQTAFIPLTVNIEWTCHGRADGLLFDGGEAVRGEGGTSDDPEDYDSVLYRSDDEGATWEACGSASPDDTGRLRWPPGGEGYLFGTKSHSGLAVPDVVGEFVTRQYTPLETWAGVMSDPFLRRDFAGLIWRASVNGGRVVVDCLDARETVEWLPCETAPFTGAYERPSVDMAADGCLWACATNTDTREMEIVYSRDNGETWQVPA